MYVALLDDAEKEFMLPVPVDLANLPALEDGRILKLPWMLRSFEAFGFWHTGPSIDIPIMFGGLPVIDTMLNAPSPTQQKPPGSGVFLQSSRLTVTLAFQFALPIRVASIEPENLRQLHEPCEDLQDPPEQVPITELVSVPVPFSVNDRIFDPGLGVEVGVEELELEAVLVPVAVRVTVAVVEGSISGKNPLPHPESGSRSAPNASIVKTGGSNRVMRLTEL